MRRIAREQAELNQGLLGLVEGERIWNVRLHARENHLSFALCTLRGIPPTEAKIIP